MSNLTGYLAGAQKHLLVAAGQLDMALGKAETPEHLTYLTKWAKQTNDLYVNVASLCRFHELLESGVLHKQMRGRAKRRRLDLQGRGLRAVSGQPTMRKAQRRRRGLLCG